MCESPDGGWGNKKRRGPTLEEWGDLFSSVVQSRQPVASVKRLKHQRNSPPPPPPPRPRQNNNLYALAGLNSPPLFFLYFHPHPQLSPGLVLFQSQIYLDCKAEGERCVCVRVEKKPHQYSQGNASTAIRSPHFFLWSVFSDFNRAFPA